MKTIIQSAMPAIMVLALLPASHAAAPSAGLQQPDITVAGYNCCEPTCECGPSCGCDEGCCDKCLRRDCCCRDCCVATVEKVKVEKHCWCTETKKVCVPKVVCPWAPGGSGLTLFSFLDKNKCGAGCSEACGCSDACGAGDGCRTGGCGSGGCVCMKPRCGKVICVNDLVKKKYECEECVCKWEVRRLPPCCDGCGNGCCAAIE